MTAALWTAIGWTLEALKWFGLLELLISLGFVAIAARYRRRMVKRGSW